MKPTIAERDLPESLNPFQSVEAAYPAELERIYESLRKGLPVMVECDKELSPFFYRCLRDRLKADEIRCVYLDGRPDPNAPADPNAAGQGLINTMIRQLRDVVRGAVGQRVVVLPHLDLLVTSAGGLTMEAKEVIPLLYENPEILFLGFKDPSFLVPSVITALFPHHESIIGIGRDRLRYLVTQRESRKFGREFNPYHLYKHVSGVNAVRLRRLLASVTGEDYPEDPGPALRQLRSATLTGGLQVPEMDMNTDIGGYQKVKDRLQTEILDILAYKDSVSDSERVKEIEGLIPRGMIFWGPPGTGKTMFAKAMASHLGAAITVISGPELKSKWVGESEERIRQIFVQARQSAPSVLVFDELDSFASQRGMYAGSSGVEHSMVNQLLTEMDGFRKDELVFVVGTTNFVESLDSALMRPGRFEFHLEIPYPNSADRRAILAIYDRKLDLHLSERALEYAVKRTGDPVPGTRAPYSGDHVQALCRAIARRRIREKLEGPSEIDDVEEALTRWAERPDLTTAEQKVVATHEAGHAVCGLFTEHSPPIERISILGDLGGSLGHVQYADPAHRYVVTRGQLLDSICVLFGGREAEALCLDDLSIGSAHDLTQATVTARSLVEEFGMGGDHVGVRQFIDPRLPEDRQAPLSDDQRERIEGAVRDILNEQRQRARTILENNETLLVALRDLLLERKVLDRAAFSHLLKGNSDG